MSMFTALRNAVKWVGFSLGKADGSAALGVVVVDPNAGANIDGDQQISYNADGQISTITVTNDDGVFVQSFTYSAGKLTAVSRWVKQ